MLRILHVVPTYLPATRYGGPIRSVHGLCKALVARGHDVHVFTTNVDGQGVSMVKTNQAVNVEGVKVWYFATGLGRRLYRSPDMWSALKRDVASFDLIHLHSVFLWPTAAAARAARCAGVPYVLSPRGMLVSNLIRERSRIAKSLWIALFERTNINNAASVHVTANLEAEELRRIGLSARRIDVVPNGVDIPPASSVEGSALGGCRPPRVLSLGRISWKKGIERLIVAMTVVPEAELWIAGNDDEGLKPRLEALAKEMGVWQRTRFMGPVKDDDKWALIRSCDILAMPSLSENFGIAALEAMACGRAVIVSPDVGIAEVVEETGSGLVAGGDPDAFGRALLSLVCDDQRRRAMGVAGREAAMARFSWPAIGEKLDRVYRECLS